MKSDYDSLPIGVLTSAPSAGQPSVILQLAHGMCGCKERFMPLMEFLSMHDVACVASDLRGHGESVYTREDLGYMYEGGYEALAADMRMVFEYMTKSYPAVPYIHLHTYIPDHLMTGHFRHGHDDRWQYRQYRGRPYIP